MPPPEQPRRDPPARGANSRAGRASPAVSAIPSFLRETGQPRAARRAAPASKAPALPRPATPAAPPPEPPSRTLDPATLPMPALSRRRVVTATGILLASLLAIGFLRQVGEATAASNRAAELRAANAALQAEVEQLQQDLSHVQDPRFIELEGRAFGLGSKGELPFALAAGAPSLAPDAPGSAAVRLGAEPIDPSPLDVWLDVLFGSR